jgi:hypothetical protein
MEEEERVLLRALYSGWEPEAREQASEQVC